MAAYDVATREGITPAGLAGGVQPAGPVASAGPEVSGPEVSGPEPCGAPAPAARRPGGSPLGSGDEPVSRLRGAGVEVDGRRARAVVVAICLAALASASIGLFLGGASKNSRIAALRDGGVPVEVTVTSCVGQLGGSGSNVAGYVCSGRYVFGGHRYDVTLPGYARREPGARLAAVAARDDPSLFSTVQALAAEHVSDGVYLLPGMLLGIVVAVLLGLAVARRSARAAPRCA